MGFHHLVTVLVFKLFIFTLVKTKKSCFEQNNAWCRFALILFRKVHDIVKLILRKIA